MYGETIGMNVHVLHKPFQYSSVSGEIRIVNKDMMILSRCTYCYAKVVTSVKYLT